MSLHRCRGCRHYSNDNKAIKTPGRPIQIGNFCEKFAWNLDRVKTWDQKLSNKKGITLPPMKEFPKECYE